MPATITFSAEDWAAIARWARYIGVKPSDIIAWGFGYLHCLTMQEEDCIRGYTEFASREGDDWRPGPITVGFTDEEMSVIKEWASSIGMTMGGVILTLFNWYASDPTGRCQRGLMEYWIHMDRYGHDADIRVKCYKRALRH